MDDLESILLTKRVLDGQFRVTTTLRPVRSAILVDPENQSMVMDAVSACTLSWGGMMQMLIPCRPGEEPQEPWMTVMDIHDPDDIIDWIGVSPDFIEKQRRRYERRVLTKGQSSGRIPILGASLFSPLRLLADEGELSKEAIVPRPILPIDHPQALRFAFRWGYFNHDAPNPAKLSPFMAGAKRHDDLINLDDYDITPLAESEHIRYLVEPFHGRDGNAARPGWRKPFDYTLLELTMAHAGAKISSKAKTEYMDEEQRSRQVHRLCVVVVGSSSSVLDLCLAWNLRARRLHSRVIWIDSSWIGDQAVQQWLEESREHMRGQSVIRIPDRHYADKDGGASCHQ